MSYPPLLVQLLTLQPLNERMRIANEVLLEFEQGKHRHSHEALKTPLIESIHQSLAEISEFATHHANNLEIDLTFALADLNHYVENVLENLRVLSMGIRQSL